METFALGFFDDARLGLEAVEALVKDLSALKNIKVIGLMTMGPELHNPEELRPYFRETKAVFSAASKAQEAVQFLLDIAAKKVQL